MRLLPYYIALQLCLGPLSLAAAGFGGSGSLLMAESLSVRALGLGRAMSAMADDESSLQANPAGLARHQGLALAGGQVLGLLDDRISALQSAWRVTPGLGLGLQAAYASNEDVARDAFGVEQGSFSNREMLLGLGLGFSLRPGWRLGLAAKGLQEEIGGSTRMGAAGDLGLQVDLPRGWSAGAAVQNLGAQNGDGLALSTPLRVQAGVAAPLFSPHWQVALDAQGLPLDGQARLLLGTELRIDLSGADVGPNRAALRGGLQLGLLKQEDPRLSLGAGLGFGQRLGLDYALGDLGALGLTHRFSLSLHFETKPILSGAKGADLSAPWGLAITPQIDGLKVEWSHSGAAAQGYNLYSDYGVLVERLNESPVSGTRQRFVKVERSRTYNFYVRPVGVDGKEGPSSEIKAVRVK